MPFRDTLLALLTYRDATPLSAVDDASAIADALGTQITAIAFEIRFQGPAPVHFLANLVVDMPGIIAAERKKSSDNARDLIAAFTRSAALRNLSHDHILERCEPSDVQGSLVEYARLRDLTIVVVPDEGSAERQLAESTIFGAGRPVMILPGAAKRDSPMALDNIVVAWDSSRAAARALCDAMPILEKAKLVRVVTVTNEQPVDTSRPIDQSRRGKELVRHLALHGVETALEVIDARGTPIGDVFEAYATSCKADLFVMGAFGHSRLRDFMLGGATQSMLDRCPLPLFLSH